MRGVYNRQDFSLPVHYPDRGFHEAEKFYETKASIARSTLGVGEVSGSRRGRLSTFSAGMPMAMTMLFCVKDAK